jgi:uncharacterized Zn finger protein
MAFNGYPEYIPVAERKSRAQKMVETLRKKDPEITPVIIALTGRKLTTTWWGKAWDDNLEQYSDYANRIGRGRSYVRNGAVLDLRIGKGRIKALVQGSAAKPYKIEIEIHPLAGGVWEKLKQTCAGQIDSLPELIDGKFPKALAELFTAQGSGLFPAPKEISLSCSCPDWAIMCKHVAAVLYGVGVRLDENPALFFTLRGVNIEELISEAIQEKSQSMVGRSGAKSRRILDNVDVTAMFGVEVATTEIVQPIDESPPKKVRKKTKND